MYAWCCQQKHKSDIIVCLINITLLFYANILYITESVTKMQGVYCDEKSKYKNMFRTIDITAKRNIPGFKSKISHSIFFFQRGKYGNAVHDIFLKYMDKFLF